MPSLQPAQSRLRGIFQNDIKTQHENEAVILNHEYLCRMHIAYHETSSKCLSWNVLDKNMTGSVTWFLNMKTKQLYHMCLRYPVLGFCAGRYLLKRGTYYTIQPCLATYDVIQDGPQVAIVLNFSKSWNFRKKKWTNKDKDFSMCFGACHIKCIHFQLYLLKKWET